MTLHEFDITFILIPRIPNIPTLIPRIPTLIPQVPNLIPRIPALIPCVPTLILHISILISDIPIIPLIPFPDSPSWLLQIAPEKLSYDKN